MNEDVYIGGQLVRREIRFDRWKGGKRLVGEPFIGLVGGNREREREFRLKLKFFGLSLVWCDKRERITVVSSVAFGLSGFC